MTLEEDLIDALEDLDGPLPQAEPNAFLLVDECRLFRTWKYRSKDSKATMLELGYWDSVKSHGVRVHDRIDVVASATSHPAEYFSLRCISDECRPRDGVHIQMMLE